MANSKVLWVVAAVIRRSHDAEQKILIVRRGPGQSNAGFWEFPGGKVEIGETPEGALKREIAEELHLEIAVGSCLGEQDFPAPTKTIRLRVYECQTADERLMLTEHDDFSWLQVDEIDPQILSVPDRPFLEQLKKSHLGKK